jgi:hypothetical protein
MTTFAALPDSQRRLAELDARTHAAWMAYRDELRELGRDAYADAEPGAWERLQAELRELDALRAELPAAR